MDRIFTGLDIGNGEIKIVVVSAGKTSNTDDNKYYVLTTTSVKTNGLKKNTIYDDKKLKSSLLGALKITEEKIGMKIKEVILTLPANRASMTMESGLVNIKGETVSGRDIDAVIKDTVEDTYDDTRELVSCLPISFTVDDEASVINPLQERGDKLFLKAVVATSPKEEIYPFINIVRSVGVNITDIIYNTQADYYTVATKELDRKMGAIINIGADITSVGVFNKGIMIKNSYIPVGSSSVDKDIAFVYKIDLKEAKKLKESFALTSARYADSNDSITVETKENKKVTINQMQISEVIESRIKEILKLAKNEINRLTKREISYIIVVGGISELAGFNYVVEETLGRASSCFNMNEIGARHNKYTSAFGSCKYFDKKCTLREKNINMFNLDEIDNFISPKKKNINDSMTNRFFGHFFDN
mgnify:CR=1 FL=1